jgi:hypothetical protein
MAALIRATVAPIQAMAVLIRATVAPIQAMAVLIPVTVAPTPAMVAIPAVPQAWLVLTLSPAAVTLFNAPCWQNRKGKGA